MNSYFFPIETPLGILELTEEDGFLVSAHLANRGPATETVAAPTELLAQAAREFAEYFQGRRRSFSLPLGAKGTRFQLAVWEALRNIPYGETRSYSEVAAAVGSPKGCRALGMACHANPLLILTPCHRVTAKHGLGGFGSGVANKIRLLELEKENL